MEKEFAERLFNEDFFDHEDQGWILVASEEEYLKHSTRYLYKYWQNPTTNEYWCVYGTIDYDYGADFDDYFQVVPKEKTVKVWEKV